MTTPPNIPISPGLLNPDAADESQDQAGHAGRPRTAGDKAADSLRWFDSPDDAHVEGPDVPQEGRDFGVPIIDATQPGAAQPDADADAPVGADDADVPVGADDADADAERTGGSRAL